MNKKSVIIICILLLVIIGLIGGIIYINNYYNKQLDYINYTSVDETADNKEEREYDCSFTKTYRVVNLLEGYIAEVPEWSFIALDQFQNHGIFAAKIPSNIKAGLEENKYYEFTYTIKGNGIIKTMEDINSHLALDDSNAELSVTLNVKETDKQGLEQIQENICIPKSSKHDTIKFNEYLTRDDGRIIYLASNMNEFYVYDSSNQKQTLKEYSKTWQTLDDIIKHITDKYDLFGELNDGGTKIYKSSKDNATVVVCHTTFGNKDVFIGNYDMKFDSESMCKR